MASVDLMCETSAASTGASTTEKKIERYKHIDDKRFLLSENVLPPETLSAMSTVLLVAFVLLVGSVVVVIIELFVTVVTFPATQLTQMQRYMISTEYKHHSYKNRSAEPETFDPDL